MITDGIRELIQNHVVRNKKIKGKILRTLSDQKTLGPQKKLTDLHGSFLTSLFLFSFLSYQQ